MAHKGRILRRRKVQKGLGAETLRLIISVGALSLRLLVIVYLAISISACDGDNTPSGEPANPAPAKSTEPGPSAQNDPATTDPAVEFNLVLDVTNDWVSGELHGVSGIVLCDGGPDGSYSGSMKISSQDSSADPFQQNVPVTFGEGQAFIKVYSVFETGDRNIQIDGWLYNSDGYYAVKSK